MYIEERDMVGTLMQLDEDPQSRYTYEIWFPFTKKAMNEIREGTLIAVPNFATNANCICQSILEITTILPMHYAIGTDTTGYPGFVVEAAQNAALDWEAQEREATEETTKIKVQAIPTNLEIIEVVGNEPRFQVESNIPMVGSQVRLLDRYTTERIANYGINRDIENVTALGSMIRDPDVRVFVRIEDLLKTHFGIFGFTGQGKSNLVSTLVAKVLSDSNEVLKLILFDLMGEYTVLLLDQLLRGDLSTCILCLGERSLPGPTFAYINENVAQTSEHLDKATDAMLNFALLPKALLPERLKIRSAIRRLIEEKKFRVFSEMENMTIFDVFYDRDNQRSLQATYFRLGAPKKAKCKEIVRRCIPEHAVTKMKDVVFNRELAITVKKNLQEQLKKDEHSDVADRFDGVQQQLDQIVKRSENQLNCGISLKDLETVLNSKERSALLVVITHNPDQLRSFSYDLGDTLYEGRRKQGQIEPLVSFAFDEADEFIPQNPKGSYTKSLEIAHTLARRGRKFGLGIGISTQRIIYLDTSIMAQPHTYFISKLPRKSDRDRLAEAFGISEDVFRQTFKFKKGNWLLISHDATGLEAVPIPIQTDDANIRIGAFLRAK